MGTKEKEPRSQKRIQEFFEKKAKAKSLRHKALEKDKLIIRGLLLVVPFWVFWVALPSKQHPRKAVVLHMRKEGGERVSRTGKGPKWSWKGGFAPRVLELRASCLGRGGLSNLKY